MKNQQEAVLPGASFDSQALAGAPQYTIDLNIDYTDHTFQGKTHILYTNREDTPIDTLYLRLLPNADNTSGNGSLEVSQVFVDGLAVESETSLSDTVLQVSLPEPLQPGESINIEMELIGIVPEDYGDPQNPTGYGIYNITDGVMALASFYPILAVYDEDGWHLDPASPIGDSVSDFKRSPCPIANTLDLLGDKWTLLIVRDLLFFGKRRYREFSASPEGIPSNLLADRLKRLERAGLGRCGKGIDSPEQEVGRHCASTDMMVDARRPVKGEVGGEVGRPGRPPNAGESCRPHRAS